MQDIINLLNALLDMAGYVPPVEVPAEPAEENEAAPDPMNGTEQLY